MTPNVIIVLARPCKSFPLRRLRRAWRLTESENEHNQVLVPFHGGQGECDEQESAKEGSSTGGIRA